MRQGSPRALYFQRKVISILKGIVTMENNIQKEAIFKLSYRVYVLTARQGDKDNGCIINTAMLVSESPYKMLVSVNKKNYTYEMIKESGELCVSILDCTTDFELIKRFGFESGRDTDKFSGFEAWGRAGNGIPYITESTNAYISGRVTDMIDVGTHAIFICEIAESVKLGEGESLTYAEYHRSVKPRANTEKTEKTGKTVYVCTVCGYEYEGEELPEDFICPWCNHGVDMFERVEK